MVIVVAGERRAPLLCMSLKIGDSPLACRGRYDPYFHRRASVELQVDDIGINFPAGEPTPEPVSVRLEAAVYSAPFYGLFLSQRIKRDPMAHIGLEFLQRPSRHRILGRKRIRFSEIACFDERQKSFPQGNRFRGNIALMQTPVSGASETR